MEGWYLEIFAASGARIKAKDGHSLDAVILAIENCAPGEYVRYLAPSNATDDEIALVKRMGAAPYGTKHTSPRLRASADAPTSFF